jgi:ribonuclease Z
MVACMLEVVLLGTGCPTPQPERYGSSYLVLTRHQSLLFDCGPGATQRLASTLHHSWQIDYLFFTHHHFDHTTDYPAFCLTRWDQGAGKAKPLQVYGPRGTEKLTEALFGLDGAWRPDMLARTHHPASLNAYASRGGVSPRALPEIYAHDVGPGIVHAGQDYTITATPAHHFQPYLDSLAYRVDSLGQSIVIAGDTGPSASVVYLARDADVFICCVAGTDERAAASDLWSSGVGPVGAARMAAEAGARKLVLVHFTEAFNRPGALSQALAEASAVFPGEIVLGEDLQVISLT